MAGRPRGTQARDHYIQIRITQAERKMLDAQRGVVSISDHVRRLIFGDKS